VLPELSVESLGDWERFVKIVLLGFVGLILGALVGGVVGVVLGFVWTAVFHTSSFEGYSGMLVFYTFTPLGIILGALIGAVGLGFLASRSDPV
jgi:hypothetical protein